MNTNRPTTDIDEKEVKPTASTLIRWAGLSAVAAGLIFAGIQPPAFYQHPHSAHR